MSRPTFLRFHLYQNGFFKEDDFGLWKKTSKLKLVLFGHLNFTASHDLFTEKKTCCFYLLCPSGLDWIGLGWVGRGCGVAWQSLGILQHYEFSLRLEMQKFLIEKIDLNVFLVRLISIARFHSNSNSLWLTILMGEDFFVFELEFCFDPGVCNLLEINIYNQLFGNKGKADFWSGFHSTRK